jgi:hypothetical protein
MTDTERANAITEVKNELFMESINGLFLMNGGGAVALASWLQKVWDKGWAGPMLFWHLCGMACFAAGTFFAGLAFSCRFLAFYHPEALDPSKNPYVRCHFFANAASLTAFAFGAVLIVVGGFVALSARG